MVLVRRVTCPDPWQVEHVDMLEASAAPVPLHESQASYFVTFSFFSVPAAISSRVSFTFTLRLVPLLTLFPLLLPPPNPPKPPKGAFDSPFDNPFN